MGLEMCQNDPLADSNCTHACLWPKGEFEIFVRDTGAQDDE